MAKAEKVQQTAEFTFELAQTIIYIPVDELNDEGLEALESYRKQYGEVPIFKVKDQEVEHLPIGVSFPYPAGGIEQHLDPAFLAAWKAKWNTDVMGRGRKVGLDCDKFIKGQARIDLNRDATPTAYKRFGKADTGSKKGARATKVQPVANSL